MTERLFLNLKSWYHKRMVFQKSTWCCSCHPAFVTAVYRRQVAQLFQTIIKHPVMNLLNIPPYEKDLINVIIETPRNSVYKYDFNPEYEVFRLNKALPMGMAFPFDFGFIPSTKGEDGDPLDVLVLMDEPAVQGALVECRLLGILEAIQTEHDGRKVRNDRIVGVASRSIRYKSISDLKHLNKDMVTEIENFFKQYNTLAGKEFAPIGWEDEEKAHASIRQQILQR